MTLNPDLLLAQDHARELRAAAAHRSLVRLATCCRPSTWRRAAASVAARLHPAPVCCS